MSTPTQRKNLHGSSPPRSKQVLLVIDMLTDFDFPDGPKLARRLRPVAENIARLCARLRERRVPVVFANDNYGRWQSSQEEILRRCRRQAVSREILESLCPREDDYFLIKPKHSAFFQTPLQLLLQHFHADTLLLTGTTLSQCVLLTAADALMREYQVWIPEGCVADALAKRERVARGYLEEILHAEFLSPSSILHRISR